jgi:nicotinamide-nucleotide amidase
MKAEIITIGDEILIGQIVDTNSAWIAREFNMAGIEIYQITSVHDDREHILKALAEAEQNADLVLLTGGLGPTKDDITKNVLCEYFGTKLFFHQPTLDAIVERFKLRNVSMNKLNHDQALMPESCTILPNDCGTAPGMWFEKNDTIFVSVPGVPFEMEHLVADRILPKLRETGRTKAIYHRTVLTQGIPESALALKIESWEDSLPPFVKLAYLPNPMSVRLRLSAIGDDNELLEKVVNDEVEKLRQIIPEAIFGYDDDELAGVIGKLLRERGATLALAESCTGGYISHLITSVAGSSDYYKGSVTAYANEVKQNLLGVSSELLEKFGAVSQEVAEQMASGARKVLNTDFAVATTGIAGPGGGTEEKPVGTVLIAIASKDSVFSKKFTFINDKRERTIIRSAQTALQLLRREILKII